MKKGIISVLSAVTGTVAGAAIGAGTVGKITGESLEKMQQISNKHLALFLMMNQWVQAKQKGKNLSDYFEKKGYKKIAIYGMSYVGETLLEELKGSEIEVVYAIDKNSNQILADVNIVSVDDYLEEVDAIVVTAITFFDEIEETLSTKLHCPILSLEDIIYDNFK